VLVLTPSSSLRDTTNILLLNLAVSILAACWWCCMVLTPSSSLTDISNLLLKLRLIKKSVKERGKEGGRVGDGEGRGGGRKDVPVVDRKEAVKG
jgi:hypothetical protein